MAFTSIPDNQNYFTPNAEEYLKKSHEGSRYQQT